MRLKSIKPIEPELSKCISVDSVDKLFTIGDCGLLTHNSVLQQNIVIGCLLRPKHWIILGVDLKKVELSRFRKFGMPAATTLEHATEFLKFAQQTMMTRYEEMEALGVNNFMDLPEPGQAILVMIDEAGELLGPAPGKSLSEHTLVKLASGEYSQLSQLRADDIIVDSNNQPTKITNIYEPDNQERFSLDIKNNETGEVETDIIAGSEHLWTARIYYKNGKIQDKQVIDTSQLSMLYCNEDVEKITFVRKENVDEKL